MNALMFVPIVIRILRDNMTGRGIWNFMTRVRNSAVPALSQMEDLGDATKNSPVKMR